MEPHEQQEEISNGGVKVSTSSSYLCRQSSTRWAPTTEQIKLLKELYYINGVRSPTADQIQTICARLRRYGKIEGKNVFYWFQNHKARERQKKRLITSNNNNNNPTSAPAVAPPPQYHSTTNGAVVRNGAGGMHWKQDQDLSIQAKYHGMNNPGASCSSSSGGVISGGGQMMGSFGYGAVTMETKFRDCSISGGDALNGGNVNHNFQWANAGNYNSSAPPPPPLPYSNFLGKIDEDTDQEHDGASEIETLPLFPMHNEDNHDHDHDHDHHLSQPGYCTIKPGGSDSYYMGGYRWPNGGGSASTSLELSLNSYGYYSM
ncbi:hypothetical protein Cgig2_019600 [Carnegiea gigantea]|uniref:Homeobox domain-containing protein n=1 Tax=Carnegiea gigantea TaxID=171969 RepID=A0A9Q1KHV4_9CARY|nr:hypothetical protein Cgig2_019600 [Carnegiea gigantea]